jgi:hypothetical protein
VGHGRPSIASPRHKEKAPRRDERSGRLRAPDMAQNAPDGMSHSSSDPDFWMYETSGVLRPAVRAYLKGKPLSEKNIAAIRAYLRVWIFAPSSTTTASRR